MKQSPRSQLVGNHWVIGWAHDDRPASAGPAPLWGEAACSPVADVPRARGGRPPVRDADVEPAVLSEGRHRDVFLEWILPRAVSGAVHQDKPVTVFVAGQPGSGKSTVSALIHRVLGQRGGAVLVSSDLYKRWHPQYPALMAEDDRTAGVKVRPTVRRWQAEVEEHARSNRFDTVVETALADPEEFRTVVAAYRRAGYRVEVAVLATPESWSQLRVLDRYLRQLESDGSGRYVSWAHHARCSVGLTATLTYAEVEQLADRITVLGRSGNVLYNSAPLSDARRRPAGAARAVDMERSRPWSAPETWRFRRELSATEQRIGRIDGSAEQRLAVSAGVERAFALAEPVRRLAHPQGELPGTHYHRLSAAQHEWIFEELIAPAYLGGIIRQVRPIVVYVMGQPGAGKTRVADLVQRTLQARGATRITAADLSASHPDYHDLLDALPRGAGTLIRADVKAWQRRLEGCVRRYHGDAVIEIAPGSPEEFFRGATAFHGAGYRVELVVLAVREADSRQGTAYRFARAAQWGARTRFTSRSGHDTCYRAVSQIAQLAEQQPAVDSVLVVRRGAHQLYRNERPVGEHSRHPGSAGLALTAERQRPYTRTEAAQFLGIQRFLHRTLPQYRTEMAEIAALARPLLPTGMRPTPLAFTAVSDLPLPVPAAAASVDYRPGYSPRRAAY